MSKGRPLSFCLKLPGPNSDDPAQKKLTWFSYDLYRGHRSRKSELLYAKTKQDSDDLAYYKSFAAEAPYHIQGFDLEWPSFPTNANTHFATESNNALFSTSAPSPAARPRGRGATGELHDRMCSLETMVKLAPAEAAAQ